MVQTPFGLTVTATVITAVRRSAMGSGSQKGVIRRFCHHVAITEYMYTNLDGIASYTPGP